MPSLKAGSRTGYHRGDGALLPLRSASSAAPRHRVERRRLPGRPHRARDRVGDADRIERGSPILFSMARQLEIVLLPGHAGGDVPMTSHEGSHWRRAFSAPRDSVSGSSRAAARVANRRRPRCRRARPSASGAKRRGGPGTRHPPASGSCGWYPRSTESCHAAARAPASNLAVGLVNVPIRLYRATRTEGIACHPLHDRRGSRIQNQSYCPVRNLMVPERSLSAVRLAGRRHQPSRGRPHDPDPLDSDQAGSRRAAALGPRRRAGHVVRAHRRFAGARPPGSPSHCRPRGTGPGGPR